MFVDLTQPGGGQHRMADRNAIEQEFHRTLEALKASHPRFAFDRDGRPAAIAAVRGALPTIERELFDAVIEDCECELAATREALFQMIAALKS
jgi:hypothetical protein